MKWPASSVLPWTSLQMHPSELDAGPECGIFVFPMLLESGSEIRLALSVCYMPAVGFVSR